MAIDYDREPLVRYMPACTKSDVSREIPKEFKFKTPEGVELKYIAYYDGGTWDPEFSKVENYEKFMEAVQAFGWKDKTIYTIFASTLTSTAKDNWKTVVAKPEFSGENQTTDNFKKTWWAYLQKRFNCKKQRDV